MQWQDLIHEPFIAHPLCDLVDHPSVTEGLQDCRIEARNTTALLAFVRAGIGITILPQTAMAEADPMHKSGARAFKLRKWLVNEGNLSLNIGLSTGKAVLS